MSVLSAISLSAMRAAQNALCASAHNIANQSTTAFRREVVMQASAVGGGVTASLRQSGLEGHALEADVVGQLEAKNQFLANLAVFRTNDAVLGSLLDITG